VPTKTLILCVPGTRKRSLLSESAKRNRMGDRGNCFSAQSAKNEDIITIVIIIINHHGQMPSF
jgi:hypothetical protein